MGTCPAARGRVLLWALLSPYGLQGCGHMTAHGRGCEDRLSASERAWLCPTGTRSGECNPVFREKTDSLQQRPSREDRRTRQNPSDTMQELMKPASPGTGTFHHCSGCPHVHSCRPSWLPGSRVRPLPSRRDAHQRTSALGVLAVPSPSDLAMLLWGRALPHL